MSFGANPTVGRSAVTTVQSHNEEIGGINPWSMWGVCVWVIEMTLMSLRYPNGKAEDALVGLIMISQLTGSNRRPTDYKSEERIKILFV